MAICTKCKAQFDDSFGFCPFCGTEKPKAVVCSACGEHVPEGALYCPKCGKPVASSLKCANCGTVNDRTASFCKMCGRSLRDKADVLNDVARIKAAIPYIKKVLNAPITVESPDVQEVRNLRQMVENQNAQNQQLFAAIKATNDSIDAIRIQQQEKPEPVVQPAPFIPPYFGFNPYMPAPQVQQPNPAVCQNPVRTVAKPNETMPAFERPVPKPVEPAIPNITVNIDGRKFAEAEPVAAPAPAPVVVSKKDKKARKNEDAAALNNNFETAITPVEEVEEPVVAPKKKKHRLCALFAFIFTAAFLATLYFFPFIRTENGDVKGLDLILALVNFVGDKVAATTLIQDVSAVATSFVTPDLENILVSANLGIVITALLTLSTLFMAFDLIFSLFRIITGKMKEKRSALVLSSLLLTIINLALVVILNVLNGPELDFAMIFTAFLNEDPVTCYCFGMGALAGFVAVFIRNFIRARASAIEE